MSYSGETSGGMRHGHGTYTFTNKYFTYEGDWVNGAKHGNGTLTFGDGSILSCTFVDGEATGPGSRTWPDGTTYRGGFLQGEFSGAGTLVSSTGERYTGEFQANRRHGSGELTTSLGDTYSGGFANHRYHGHGVWNSKSGASYTGVWEDGMKHGEGVFVATDGYVYTGTFYGGLRHGTGSICPPAPSALGATSPGLTYSGPWEEDCPTAGGRQFAVDVAPYTLPEEPVDPKAKPKPKAAPAKGKKGEVEEPIPDPHGTLVLRAGVPGPDVSVVVCVAAPAPAAAAAAVPVTGRGAALAGIVWAAPNTGGVDAVAVAESGRRVTAQLLCVSIDAGEASSVPLATPLSLQVQSEAAGSAAAPTVAGGAGVDAEAAADSCTWNDVSSAHVVTASGVARVASFVLPEALPAGLYRLQLTDSTDVLPYGVTIPQVNIPIRLQARNV